MKVEGWRLNQDFGIKLITKGTARPLIRHGWTSVVAAQEDKNTSLVRPDRFSMKVAMFHEGPPRRTTWSAHLERYLRL